MFYKEKHFYKLLVKLWSNILKYHDMFDEHTFCNLKDICPTSSPYVTPLL